MTMTTTARRIARAVGLAAALGLAAGCSTLSALGTSTAALEAFTLTPAAAQAAGGRLDRQILVEAPTTTGALNTDRIMIRPGPLQVQYLPGARWIDPVPVLVQSLMVRSIADSGRVRYVSPPATAVFPDYALQIDVRDFQAEIGPPQGPPVRVVVRLDLALVRETDRTIVGTRRLERTAPAASVEAGAVVAAFQAAMQGVLAEGTAWAVAGGGGS